MSLLLDALRRAEEDSRKRKLDVFIAGAGSARTTSPADPAQGPAAELTLQVQTLSSPLAPELVTAGARAATAPQVPLPESDFPDLMLAVDQPAAVALFPQAVPAIPVSNPGTPIQPRGRYARSAEAEAGEGASPAMGGQAVAFLAGEPVRSSMGHFAAPASVSPSNAAAPASTGALERSPPVPGTTQRQAISAASAMADASVRKVKNKPTRRQWLFATAALVVAPPLAAFLLFGDALFGSSCPLLEGKPIVPSLVLQTAASQASAEPPVEVSVSGNLPAAASEPAGAAATDRNVVAAAQLVVGMVPTSAPQGAGGPFFASSGSAPVASRPRVVTQNSARITAPRQAPAGGEAHNREGTTSGGKDMASGPNAAKPATLMDAAYAFYQAGKTAEATRLYQDVLRVDPTQRDAWLGLAVIAHASKQREPAMDAYKRVLRLEPQNATALAGLSGLITNAGEPQQESKLRDMLARSPQEADLNNALGLVLSGEKRWSEAQSLFFKAHSAEPQEPQFAYNLAVTLDHLRKSGLAAQYYETAIGLAQGRASGFDEASARARLATLKASAAAGAAR